MDLEARKISFVQQFLRLQNEDIISGLENLLQTKKAELLKPTSTSMSISDLNAEIDQAMADSENGKMIKATDLKKKIQKWS